MMSTDPTTLQSANWLESDSNSPHLRPALVLLWSVDEPERVGEVAIVPERGGLIGRGSDPDVCSFLRQRPGRSDDRGPLTGRSLSRRQLVVRAHGGAVEVQNVGRASMSLRGAPASSGVAQPGELLEVNRKALFLVTERPHTLPEVSADVEGPWAKADALGIVGESPAVWALRERLAFLGPRRHHSLVLGESGTGKELAARALHVLSDRAGGPWVSRNASTLPEGLVDAELFGHAANYPNPGMPLRRGLIGEADGGTLFLDEIGELPHALQARLLRVLDSGEYQRLGETRRRTAAFRLIGATNRSADALKHDIAARLTLRVEMPSLRERREDIPLLIDHLLTVAFEDDALRRRFADDAGQARLDPQLVAALVTHAYTHNVRELHALLWASLGSSTSTYLELTDEVLARLNLESTPLDGDWTDWVGAEPSSIPPDALQACLDAHNGEQQSAFRALGLASRHQLARLVKKHGLLIRKSK